MIPTERSNLCGDEEFLSLHAFLCHQDLEGFSQSLLCLVDPGRVKVPVKSMIDRMMPGFVSLPSSFYYW